MQYREVVEELGGLTTFPRGVSMRPLLRTGKTYVNLVKTDDPALGDILYFEEMRQGKKANILHRLIEICPDGTYVCRGDNCLGCEYVKRDQIVGRVESICWTKGGSRLTPWLLGAKRDTQSGVYRLSVNDAGYLRYVRFWNTIWPVRRVLYKLRGHIGPRALYRRLYARLARVSWLRRTYRKLRHR